MRAALLSSLFVAACFVAQPISGVAQPVLRSYAFSSGAVDVSNEGYRLRGTLGQPIVGVSQRGDRLVQAGLWYQLYPGAPTIQPVAVDDDAATDVGQSVDVNVLRNDIDPGGTTLTIYYVGEPGNGQATLKTDSVITYTPLANFAGVDTFTYSIRNAAGDTASAHVRVTVGAGNSPPVFTSLPVTGIAAGDPYQYEITTEDPDGETVTIGALLLPEWLSLAVTEENTATLSGDSSFELIGDHPVVLLATDGIDTTYQSFTVTVVEGAPAAVVLALPADEAVDVTMPVALTWRTTAGAASYRAQVSTSSDFTGLTWDATELSDTTYQFDDADVLTTYYWRVAAANGAGEGPYSETYHFTTASTVTSAPVTALPTEFGLDQNYPNPFNPSTIINFQLPQPAHVRLVVYDVFGREVARLVDEERPAGVHELTFDAGELASGMYFYQVRAGRDVRTRQMLLIR